MAQWHKLLPGNYKVVILTPSICRKYNHYIWYLYYIVFNIFHEISNQMNASAANINIKQGRLLDRKLLVIKNVLYGDKNSHQCAYAENCH